MKERKQINKHLELQFAEQTVSEDGLTFEGTAITLETKNNSHKVLFRSTAFEKGEHKAMLLYAHDNRDDKKVIGQAILTVDGSNKVKFKATLMPELDDTDSKTVSRTSKMLKAGILDSVSIGVSYSDYKYHWDEKNWKDSYLEVKKSRFTELSVVHAGSDPEAKIKKINFSLDEAQFLLEQEKRFCEVTSEVEESSEEKLKDKGAGDGGRESKMAKVETPAQSANNLNTLSGLEAELSDHRAAIDQKKFSIKNKKEELEKNKNTLTLEEQKEFKREIDELVAELGVQYSREDSLKSQISLMDAQQRELFKTLDLAGDEKEKQAEMSVMKIKFAEAWVENGSRFAVTVAPSNITTAFMTEIIETAFKNGTILKTIKKVPGKAVINTYNVFTANHSGGKGEYQSKVSADVSPAVDTISLAYARYKASTLITHEIREGTGMDLYNLLVRTISESLIKLLETDWVHGASTNTKLSVPDGFRGVASDWAVTKKLSKIVTFNPADNILDNMLVNLSAVKGRKEGEKVNAYMSEFTYLKMLRQGGPVTNESLWTKLMDKFNFIETPEMQEDLETTPTGAPYIVLGVNEAYHGAFEDGKQIRIGETQQDDDLESKLFGHVFASGMPTEEYSFLVITDGTFVANPTKHGLLLNGVKEKKEKGKDK